MVTGFATARLLSELDPRWLVMALGAAFVALGAGVFLLAAWSHRRGTQERGLLGWVPALLAAVLTVLALWLLLTA